MSKVKHFECNGEFDTKEITTKRIDEHGELGEIIVFDCPCCGKETNSLDCG